jgi:hypothetical protein
MDDPLKDRRFIEIFQRRRQQCGLAVFLFLAANAYLVLLLNHCRGTFTACDPFLDIPVLVHFILVALTGFGSFLFIVETFRCPNCEVIPRASGKFYVYSGPEYTYNPEECHSCGIRLKQR